MYMVTNDDKVSHMSSHILPIPYITWYNLAPNRLVTQLVDWVKFILN